MSAGAADETLSPLGDDALGFWAPPRNTWAAYVQGLAGAVRQLEPGLAAGQAPPRPDHGDAAPSPDEPAAAEPASEAQLTASVPPVAELRYKVQFTADQAYVDLLEEARNLLQHEIPARDLVAVQRRALELLVHKLRQRKYAASERPRRKSLGPVNGTPKPQPARPPTLASTTHASHAAPKTATPARHSAPKSATDVRHSATQSANQNRYIAAEVRRAVWKRDEGRCTYVDARGLRCREQSGLEFHHQHPHGRGGPPSIDNITLRCRAHNAFAAEQDFGRDTIRQKQASKATRAHKATLTESSRAGPAP